MTKQRYMLISRFILVLGIFALIGCQSEPERFTRMAPEETGVNFANNLTETPDLNIFNYLYFYDGGGIAAGDLNGDDLPDLFFTSNQEQNKLYLNRGDFKFEDVTNKAIGDHVDDWSTGVAMADVNGDGRLDIYVSNVGSYLKIQGENKLYINQGKNEDGIPQFEEKGEEYGLDLIGFSTQAAFFDYDRDGDLDLYMMNHSVHSNETFDNADIRHDSHPLAGDRLMRNDNGQFVDVTESAGIYNSALGYGLGVGISDLNKDGWPDIYIGNDFHEDDYLYINNGDGTFTEMLGEMMPHTSRSSMGNELVDINNDELPDIYSLDMLPSDYEVRQASAAEDPFRIYNSKLGYGYKHQFSRNTLQLNRGNGKFSDIGLLAEIYATDWSWATLGADFDHNGYVDLFVTNGIKGRTNELDYIEFISQDSIQFRLEDEVTESDLEYRDRMSEEKVSNFMFNNKGALDFESVAEKWGLARDSFSSGAAYADLDQDGDLDIIVNNVDQRASIYRNETSEKFDNNNYLKFELNGPDKNHFGIGTKVRIPLSEDNVIFREMYPVRGYQSSVAYNLHVGLDTLQSVPQIEVIWPDGKKELLENVAANQTLTLDYADAVESNSSQDSSGERLFTEITDEIGISYKHEENDFIEFNREALIPKMVSREGPSLAIADVNDDGRDDFYAGGAKNQPGELYLQQQGGAFAKKEIPDFSNDETYEDVDAAFGDFDNDGDQDLFVVSGGNEYYGTSEYMQPRLYVNDGNGNFVRDEDALEPIYLTGSAVAKTDVDGDGDLDLFVGARTVPWKYGIPPTSYLLINDGGKFHIDSSELGEKLSDLGMVTDAEWGDINGDGKPDLVVASEWSGIKIVYQESGRLHTLPEASGIWNAVALADIDGDGQIDILGGNLGLNSKFKASQDKPMRMYVNDFDENGTEEQIVTYIDDDGTERLFARKDELAEQLDYIDERFDNYQSFAEASLTEVIDRSLLDNAQTYTINELRSAVFYNRDGQEFEKQTLPIRAQFAPLHDFMIQDFYGDDLPDVVGVGNFLNANIQRGRYDASYGEVMINNGSLESVPNKDINWYLKGQIRKIDTINIGGSPVMITAENDAPLRFFEFVEEKDEKTEIEISGNK